MSLLMMLLALLGAVAVLGLGSWVTGRLRRSGGAVDDGGAPAPAVEAAGAVPPAGGYTLLEEPGAPAVPLSAEDVERVRALLAQGRGNEAVGAVRDATGADEERAAHIVRRIRATGRP
ncbi:hypothetical protein [Streptomonospora nanhaiensis]|uniref:Ribosomal protein L7/L12 C-terminal domain-containing protein n=1 Tax=Streptomonospora nanhaiensis TaxID=1323731 RepID=A0A853BPA7_9ACTN|nr:hypothetical protein [Streptomonospora nanhaiensis]MBV2365783.1 hypothetical protein [Streptomonospora nanhaiensis]NYI96457.1 hypothetical protein [Streptomonospora nanhaiensis]